MSVNLLSLLKPFPVLVVHRYGALCKLHEL